ncbi:alpha/beta fold hydrolase [Altererythrobacter indicus]|uniref:Alpha/beta fold hydrolase n=1 Tax=Altericroceibacterium indicum TaxID=374177 RepID=A0A845A596_9SPHN|nr:alpha/beta fold hydrolase [Altericroceibacterium indicum]MXP24904.1 alpha/beta fold hydrolase [Altericroceibacterium indicum]
MNSTTFASFDGTQLALHRISPENGTAGRTVILLHGLFSSAEMNWVRFGHAKKLAESGFDVVMPDLRAHGESAAPHGAEAYPPDVLVRDAKALVDHLALEDYDLVGFSLGSRTAVRAVIAGLTPRKLVLCGMGLEGLAGWDKRAAFFIDAIDRFDDVKRGDPAFMAVSFMKTMKVDREAARLLLQSVDDTSADELAAITMPTLVVCGDQDNDNGSAEKLVAALPDAHFAEVPGTHMSSVTEAALGDAIRDYLID